MVVEMGILRADVAQKLGHEAIQRMQSWNIRSELGLKLCQAAVLKASTYYKKKGVCSASDYNIHLHSKPSLEEMIYRKTSEYFCSLQALDAKMAELRGKSKHEKDIAVKDDIKEQLEALGEVRKEFVRLFGNKSKIKIMDSKGNVIETHTEDNKNTAKDSKEDKSIYKGDKTDHRKQHLVGSKNHNEPREPPLDEQISIAV